MAWLSSNSFVSGTLITHTMFNNLSNDIRNWGGDVNAGGFNLMNLNSFGTSGPLSAAAFVGNPNVVLRPMVDGPKGIDMQNVAGVTRASLNTIDGTLSVLGFLSSSGYSGNPKVVIRPSTNSGSAIELQNAAGTPLISIDTLGNKVNLPGAGGIEASLYQSAGPVVIRPGANSATGVWFQGAGGAGTAAAIDTTLSRIVAGAGGVIAPYFTGSPVVLRPTTDSGTAIQFQNAAGTTQAFVNVLTGQMAAATFSASATIYSPLYLGVNNVQLRPSANSTGAIQFQDYAGTAFAVVDTINYRVGIGTNAPQQRLHVSQPFHGNVAHFSADDGNANNYSSCGITLGRINAPFAGITSLQATGGSYSGGEFVISTRAGDVLAERVRINSAGFMAISTVGALQPGFRIHAFGIGTPSSTTFSPIANGPCSICVLDYPGQADCGGAVILGAGSSNFAAMRARFSNGAGWGVGVLSFYVRADTGSESLSESLTLYPGGGLRLPGIPAANPGAGSKLVWYDPADGNRLKFAA